ncbi:hypothetical protein GCM10022245_15960 [Streptomyces mayteni]
MQVRHRRSDEQVCVDLGIEPIDEFGDEGAGDAVGRRSGVGGDAGVAGVRDADGPLAPLPGRLPGAVPVALRDPDVSLAPIRSSTSTVATVKPSMELDAATASAVRNVQSRAVRFSGLALI